VEASEIKAISFPLNQRTSAQTMINLS